MAPRLNPRLPMGGRLVQRFGNGTERHASIHRTHQNRHCRRRENRPRPTPAGFGQKPGYCLSPPPAVTKRSIISPTTHRSRRCSKTLQNSRPFRSACPRSSALTRRGRRSGGQTRLSRKTAGRYGQRSRAFEGTCCRNEACLSLPVGTRATHPLSSSLEPS